MKGLQVFRNNTCKNVTYYIFNSNFFVMFFDPDFLPLQTLWHLNNVAHLSPLILMGKKTLIISTLHSPLEGFLSLILMCVFFFFFW